MDNKIIEFISEFNGALVKLNQYSELEYVSNGFYEAINAPQVNLFDDGNYPTEHFRKIALAHLLKVTSDWSEVAGNMFADEVWAWEKEIKKQLKDRFPKAKSKLQRLGTLRYKIVMSGEYEEEAISSFIDVVYQDFEYMFDGCKLDYEY